MVAKLPGNSVPSRSPFLFSRDSFASLRALPSVVPLYVVPVPVPSDTSLFPLRAQVPPSVVNEQNEYERRATDEKEKGIANLPRPLRVGHFVHLRAPSSGAPWPPFAPSPPPSPPLRTPLWFARLTLFRRLPSFFYSSSVSPRSEKERHGYFNENPARLCRHLSYLHRRASRLMNAPCKYYFCLCTRQLSATLVLINNAKQTRPGQGDERGWRRSLATRLRRCCGEYTY